MAETTARGKALIIEDRPDTVRMISDLAEELLARVQNQETPYRLRRELENANHQLEDRVVELAALNKELQDFAYVVSHDLKAPLRAINRLVHWLVEDYAVAFDAKGKEMTDLLVSRVNRMDQMVSGILEYSRGGRVVGQNEPLDLNQLLPEVIDLLAPSPSIQVTISPKPPIIVGDNVRIQQVFQNLRAGKHGREVGDCQKDCGMI